MKKMKAIFYQLTGSLSSDDAAHFQLTIAVFEAT
jgi:hypothetical protein